MQSIEIRTAQRAAIEYALASLQERIFALILDVVVVFFLIFGLAMLLVMSGVRSEALWMIVIILSMGPGFVLYSIICETFMDGQSAGKRAQRIKVVRLDGRELGQSDIMLRGVLQLVDFYYTAGAVGALLVSASEKRQRLGDMAAGTAVVRTKRVDFRLSDILNIVSLENYQPAYPGARGLAEADLLTVRSVLKRFEKFRNDAGAAAVGDLAHRLAGLADAPLSNHADLDDCILFLKTLTKDYIVLTR